MKKIYEKIKHKLILKTIPKVKNFKEQPLSETMKLLEPEDLIKYGLIPEFIGRMPIIATLDDLDEKS